MLEGPRAARPEEFEAVVALSDAVFRSNKQGSMGQEFPTLFCRENLGNLRIILDGGTPVSLVAFTVRDTSIMGTRIRVACFGSVCTLPDHQGRGFATRLMENGIAEALKQGAQLALISGGRGLYRRMGCIDAGLYERYPVMRSAQLPVLPVTVAQWEEANVARMAAVHQLEPVRFIRSAGEFLQLLQTGWLEDRPADTWTVKSGGELVAYLSVQKPIEENGVRIARAREIAGPRLAVLSAVGKLFLVYDAQRIDLYTTAIDAEMRVISEQLGIRPLRQGFHGTMKIIDVRGFFRAIRPFIDERLFAEESEGLAVSHGPEITFSHHGEAFSVKPAGELNAFVFGSIEQEPPVPATPGIGRILKKVFPMPLVGYGLNYI